jgi:ABC-2 type transport system permease protein
MKNSLWVLVKAHFLNSSGINQLRYEKDQKKRARATLFLIGMLIVAGMLISYVFAMGYGMGAMGLGEIIPLYALTFASTLIFVFTFLKAGGVLFAFKEYDRLMSLPVLTTTLITSRFLVMYGINLFWSLFMMLPMGIAYALWQKPGWIFYVFWSIIILFTPLFPMTLACLITTFLSSFASKFKKSNVVNIILSFGLVFGIMVASFSFQGMDQEALLAQWGDLGKIISVELKRFYPLAIWVERAVLNKEILPLILFVAFSLGCYYGLLKLMEGKYKKIHTNLTTYATKSNFKLKDTKTGTPFLALYKKEMKRFFSSSLYVLNTGIGSLSLLVGSVALLILGASQIEKITGISYKMLQEMGPLFAPFIVSGLLSGSCTACVSLSLEGKNLWMLQSLPIEPKVIYKSKIAVNVSLLLPVALLSAGCLSIFLRVQGAMLIWLFVTPVVYSFFTGVWGIFINRIFYDFTWENEVRVIKQSVSSMLGILGGFIVGFVPLFVISIVGYEKAPMVTGVITLLVLGITIVLYKQVSKRPLPWE